MPRSRANDEGTQKPVGPETADLAFMKRGAIEYVHALSVRGQGFLTEYLFYAEDRGRPVESVLVSLVPGSIEILATAAQANGLRTRIDPLGPRNLGDEYVPLSER